jgi:hypothetical protein
MDSQDVSLVCLLYSILPACHPEPHRLTSRVSHCSPLLPGENSAPDLASDDVVLIPRLKVPATGWPSAHSTDPSVRDRENAHIPCFTQCSVLVNVLQLLPCRDNTNLLYFQMMVMTML